MKLIIAVTFLGILMCAFAEKCELKPPVANFDSEKYFNISRSYATYANNGPENKICREYVTTKNKDGTTKTVYTISDKSYTTDVAVECNNTEVTNPKGQFSVACKLPQGNTFQLTTSVIATDYEKYVILQACLDNGPGEILVLQTNKTEEIPQVNNYIAEQRGYWYSRRNVRSC